MVSLGLVIVAKGGHGGNTLTMFDPGQTSLFGFANGGVFGGVLLGILLFVGFEAAASIAEESHDPRRSIPRAVLWTVGAAAAFFIFMGYAFSIGYGKAAVAKGAWALDPSAVDTMATRYVGSWLATILDLVVILDAIALALAICVTIGRGFFALGRDGLLPRAFARTSRFNTPWVGNLMVLVGGAGLILLATNANYFHLFTAPGPGGKPVPVFPNDQFATFIMAATVGSFAVELVYLMLAVAMTRILYKRGATVVAVRRHDRGDRDAGARLLRRAQARPAQHHQLQLGRAVLHAGADRARGAVVRRLPGPLPGSRAQRGGARDRASRRRRHSTRISTSRRRRRRPGGRGTRRGPPIKDGTCPTDTHSRSRPTAARRSCRARRGTTSATSS